VTGDISYRDAGVDLDAARRHTENIGRFVVGGAKGFASTFPLPEGMREPLLVTCTDGVGTKLLLALEMGRLDGLGQDLVAMSLNDLACTGARPLVFLDYLAVGKLDPDAAGVLVEGIARACASCGCALVGGETAELPGLYAPRHFDLAGFAVGVVEKSRIIDGCHITPGDVVLGLASDGVHSNGYSLVRRIIASHGGDLSGKLGNTSIAELLLAPTRIYVRPVLEAMKCVTIKGLAHITGGGLLGNVPRVLKDDLTARIDSSAWERPPIFRWLEARGNVPEDEMLRVFNCGIGMAAIVSAADAERATDALKRSGETVFRIGVVERRRADEPQTIVA
jgi:phosphoribosylformylglycinamidine cyclo-ligase